MGRRRWVVVHAGTLGLLEDAAEDSLESWARRPDNPPALDVRKTQETLDDRPVQQGRAAAYVEDTVQDVLIEGTAISRTSDTGRTLAYTGWVAEVTGSGIVVAESIGADDDRSPFPFDLFTARTNRRCRRYSFDIQQLASAWLEDDVLTDVWMIAFEDVDENGSGVSLDYGENAFLEDVDQASIGLGFVRTFEGSETKGVVFEGGYHALYRGWPAEKFVRFVEAELVPFAFEYEPEKQQVDFDEIFGGG